MKIDAVHGVDQDAFLEMHSQQVIWRCGGDEKVRTRARQLYRPLPVDRLMVCPLRVGGA